MPFTEKGPESIYNNCNIGGYSHTVSEDEYHAATK